MFNFPLAYHEKIIHAIRAYGSIPVCRVADISERVIQLRNSIDVYRKSAPNLGDSARHIETTWQDLLRQARALRSSTNPFVQVTSRALELLLRLSWSSRPAAEDLTLLAGELRAAISQLPMRPCMFMDLTSSQLMLGAIAAAEGSEVRAWFVARLRRAVSTLRDRGWPRPLEIIERGFVTDVPLVDEFRTLWRELDG